MISELQHYTSCTLSSRRCLKFATSDLYFPMRQNLHLPEQLPLQTQQKENLQLLIKFASQFLECSIQTNICCSYSSEDWH